MSEVLIDSLPSIPETTMTTEKTHEEIEVEKAAKARRAEKKAKEDRIRDMAHLIRYHEITHDESQWPDELKQAAARSRVEKSSNRFLISCATWDFSPGATARTATGAEPCA